MKKCLSFLICFALVINTVAPVFAMDSNTDNSSNGIEYVEGGFEKIQVSVIRQNFETLHVSYSKQGRSLGDIWNKLVPDIHIKNKHVAGTINAIITGVAFAAGAGSLSLALKKYGAKQLKVMFTKTLKNELLEKLRLL